MSESRMAHGRDLVMQDFERIKEEYMDRIPPIDRVLKWRGGDNFDTSQVEDGNDRFLKYYLAFEVDKEIHYIVFMRRELDGRTDAKDSGTKDQIERKIREKLRSIFK